MRRLIKRSQEGMWRTIEWSFVMSGLSWLLVRAWIDSIRGDAYPAGSDRGKPNQDREPFDGRRGRLGSRERAGQRTTYASSSSAYTSRTTHVTPFTVIVPDATP